jgi:hypothetical protein
VARKHSISNKLDVVGLPKPTARSRITNGADLLTDIDHRTHWYRRFRDLCALHLSDLGGEDMVSESEKALVRRCAALNCELERMEADFAANGQADLPSLEAFQRCSNTLRRLLQALGLQRRAKDITPSVAEYVRSITDEEVGA